MIIIVLRIFDMILDINIAFRSIGIDEEKAKRAVEAIVMAIEQRCELNHQLRLANTKPIKSM